MTLTFHFLNVSHGSSIVIDYDGPDGRSFGVVDSNGSGEMPPALRKLNQLGAQRLSFLCVTHPHMDHFNGMYRVIETFRGKIGTFLSYSIGDQLKHQADLKKLAQTLKTIDDSTDDAEIKRGVNELLRILMWAQREMGQNWAPCDGESNTLALDGFAGVAVTSILPPKRAKGDVLEAIRKNDPNLFGYASGNTLSLALEFQYAGRTVILGGDGTAANWAIRSRFWEKKQKHNIFADVANLPHHGSLYDCSPDVLAQLFKAEGADHKRQIAVTSADGQHHPHEQTIRWLEKNGIEPYCTGLLPMCGGKATNLLQMANLDAVTARWAREVCDDLGRKQPCQGDISVSIDNTGNIDVSTQYATPCSFRGDYDRLFV